MAGPGNAIARQMGTLMADEGPVTVCFPFVGDLVGGSHISACGLIRKIDRRRFSPLVLVQYPGGAIARLFEEAGITVEVAPPSTALHHGSRIGALRGLSLAGGAVPLARFLRRRGVAIVHSNDGRTHATWALAAKLARAKLLWHHRGSPDAAGLRLAAPLLANRVVAVSRFASPRSRGISAAGRTAVIHSPFDTSLNYDRGEARQTILSALSLRSDARLIAFSGALIDRKRPLLFVDAVAALRRRMPDSDVHGLLFGGALDGMDEQVSDRARRHDVADSIHLMGFRSPGAFWLAGCDMLMVPAIDEPFGRTLIEAMLVGTPVVATASGGNVEAIRDGETGRLVPPESADALGEACAQVLGDPQSAARMADAAQQEARSRFGETCHAEAIMALYDDMLCRRTRVWL